ncbi:hypothetical protein [Paraburkholderia denitrificans]|uniref:hypothetical protein n=1 Tax=Paraburkholderia denitrificans TaxID=694025 RepID=UPI00366EDC50
MLDFELRIKSCLVVERVAETEHAARKIRARVFRLSGRARPVHLAIAPDAQFVEWGGFRQRCLYGLAGFFDLILQRRLVRSRPLCRLRRGGRCMTFQARVDKPVRGYIRAKQGLVRRCQSRVLWIEPGVSPLDVDVSTVAAAVIFGNEIYLSREYTANHSQVQSRATRILARQFFRIIFYLPGCFFIFEERAPLAFRIEEAIRRGNVAARRDIYWGMRLAGLNCSRVSREPHGEFL